MISTMKVNQEGKIEEYQCRLRGGNLNKSSGKLKKSSELEISGKNRYSTYKRFLKDLGFKKAGDNVNPTYENALRVKGGFQNHLDHTPR